MKILKILFLILTIILIAVSCEKSNTDKIEDNSIVDARDGKKYATISIGNQLWMAENLAFKSNSGSWVYDNDESNVEKYGYLYDWKTACEVCPSGWHLPDDNEWMILKEELGMKSSETNLTGSRGRDEYVGVKLSLANELTDFQEYKNESGFSIIVSGKWDYYIQKFTFNTYYSFFWTSSESTEDYAWLRKLYTYDYGIERTTENKLNGYSVRCIKD